eukprot:CAMPEP_0182848896 /NCGR_PEP_ID=MMETSP0006_2-20121128/29243_1 /TAXON_ID=97485 /ORGANISM="Prymnesium parvum, Strain Texoma1" /LENGTH=134 /DNA_ID=CAMNT_0024979341 /DNA_START=213 /DNA_END=618 /DNA_ORIENTATION=+
MRRPHFAALAFRLVARALNCPAAPRLERGGEPFLLIRRVERAAERGLLVLAQSAHGRLSIQMPLPRGGIRLAEWPIGSPSTAGSERQPAMNLRINLHTSHAHTGRLQQLAGRRTATPSAMGGEVVVTPDDAVVP